MSLAKRIAEMQTDFDLVSYWLHGAQVYRLQEYENVQFDIYGLPLGAHWECHHNQWEQFKDIILGLNAKVFPH